MNIEQEFPLHVAVWNNDVGKLTELITRHKVSFDCGEFSKRKIWFSQG